MPKLIDLTGKRFGKLTVIKKSTEPGKHSALWIVKCDCGTEKTVESTSLKTGNTSSCGCGLVEWQHSGQCNRKHGSYNSPEYDVWDAMKQRCRNPNSQMWKYYGARGISVCERWIESFDNFIKDMGPRPKGGTIDRINNDGNYEPSNCRWTSMKEQNKNKRKKGSALITVGRE